MKPVHYHIDCFPPKNINWEELIPLIGKSTAAVARFDGALMAMPTPAILLSPLTIQEAVLSSKIEGTRATMGEVLEFEAKGDNSKDDSNKEDILEIQNYRKALNQAVEDLEEMPLCQRLIKSLHRILMNSVRGHGKAPGSYRSIPNWIGSHGSTIDNARYVPISVDKLDDAMSAWEKYIHSEQPDQLVQLAILHAEFESLHPFLDGNGRLGRMCIPLFMYEKRIISKPMFYISEYFEKNRELYYDKLLCVSRNNDWMGWISFFLTAVEKQAQENHKKAMAILELYNNMKKKIAEVTKSQYAIHTLEWLFKHQIFNGRDFSKSNNIKKPTAAKILSKLVKANIIELREESKGTRSSIYIYPDLLNIAEGRKVF